MQCLLSLPLGLTLPSLDALPTTLAALDPVMPGDLAHSHFVALPMEPPPRHLRRR